jgi:anti-sigma factor (TIGR02949 family)
VSHEHEHDHGPGADPDPGHTDCAVVIREVWSMLDGEVTDDERERLRRHLDQCPACLRHYGVEERIKKLIATKCSGDKAPSYLVERVRSQISQTTISRRGY